MSSRDLTTGQTVDARVPSFGVVLLRGAGWGSLLGAIFGFFVFPVDDLLTFHEDPFTPFSLYLGVFTAPFGSLYGLVAGFVSAVCFLPFASVRRPARAARVVAATIGPLVVAAISLLVFQPSMAIGGNETSEHVRERLVMFYLFPCTAAALSGAVAGARLARPTDSSWAVRD